MTAFGTLYSGPMNQSVAADAAETDRRVTALMQVCDRALSARQINDADKAFKEAERLSPDHPAVRYEHAKRAFASGDHLGARDLLKKVVAANPKESRYWHGYASVLRTLNSTEEEVVALEGALKVQPRDTAALLYKAAALERMGRVRTAARIYTNALQTVASETGIPEALRPLLQRANEASRAIAQEFSDFLQTQVGERQMEKAGTRAGRYLDLMLDRVGRYSPQPTGAFFPFLRNCEFHDRAEFPWLRDLESATADIRSECLATLREDGEGLEPYVAYRDGLPLDQWKELNNSRRWSAYFLWKESARLESHLARCPKTEQALSAIPRVDIPGFGPTAFFSILDAKTRIPPHHGVTNTRLTVHLPLVIPEGCRFRVGGEVRPWEEGKAWVFDDSIEHEAVNDSDVPRAILIFDVWNPQLTEQEKDLVRETTLAHAAFFGVEGLEGVGL